jgi:hypothetical protein
MVVVGDAVVVVAAVATVSGAAVMSLDVATGAPHAVSRSAARAIGTCFLWIHMPH